MKSLDQRLWLEGNLSVGYGKRLAVDNDEVFSLKFEPCEVEKALDISDVTIKNNNWYSDIIHDKPAIVACFPYSQHFISDSPGSSSKIKDKNELIKEVSSIDFKNVKVLSVKYLKTMFIINSILSLIVTITLLLLYLTK